MLLLGPSGILAAAALVGGPGDEPIPPTPFDREIVLELSADDPVMIEGRGPAQVVEYVAEFEGTLHVWTSSELDLFLRAEDVSTMGLLGEDDDSGGGSTPYLRLEVNAGTRLAVFVAEAKGSSDGESTGGPLVLHFVAAPETAATRELAAAVRRALSEAQKLQGEGDLVGARELVKAAILEGIAGAETSQGIADALRELGLTAYNAGEISACSEALSRARRHRERTLPTDHPDLLAVRANLALSLFAMGDLAGARALREAALAGYERTVPDDHPDLLAVRAHLAISLSAMGDIAGARALREAVLAGYERTLPEDHPDLLRARVNLASSLSEMGDLAGARALEEAVLAARERTLPEDHPSLLLARGNLASSLSAMGDLAGARALREAVLAGYERTLPEDHPSLLLARGNLASSLYTMGDLAGARALQEAVLAGYERTLPEDHPDLLLARANLAVSLFAMGDLAGARALREAVLAGCERTLPEDHPDLLRARVSLANSLAQMGDLAGARVLQESVLAGYERTLPEDHPSLLAARASLASSLRAMGDLADARALREAVLAGYERTLPEDHPSLLLARSDLAASLSQLGDLAGARALEEVVLAARERTLPEDHPNLLLARGNLASSMSKMGDLAGARALQEAVLAGYERTHPEDHPSLLLARGNLASSMSKMGDLAGARALREAVLAGYERTHPEDHPDLLWARAHLAVSLSAMGDLAGARALREAVLAGYERTLPEDHPDLLLARANLANSIEAMGDLAGARALREAVLAGYERTLPKDHPDLLRARANLALSLSGMGDLPGARALEEAVLAARERTLPTDHPSLLSARVNLANSIEAMGDLAGARALREAVLADYERTLPKDHPYLLLARANLAASLSAMDDLAGARALLPPLCDGMRARVVASLTLSPREARQVVAAEGLRLGSVHFFSASAESELQEGVFELTETMRLVTGEAARSLARFDTDPELAPILAEAASVRRLQGDLIAGAGRDERDAEAIAAELTRLSFERDRLERKAVRRLAERGVVTRPVEMEALAGALAAQDSNAVAVGYRRLPRWHMDEATGTSKVGDDHLFAHVLSASGTLTRVELGQASELEELATAWRASLGAPLLRGVAVSVEDGDPEVNAGVRLRERLLDPVLAAAGDDVQRLFVCADDLVFLIPLEALPVDDDGVERIGDRVRIVSEVSFARLMAKATPIESEPSLLAFGGVDYDAAGDAPERLFAAAPPVDDLVSGEPRDESSEDDPTVEAGATRGTRSAMPARFRALRHTRYEAEDTGELFEEAFELEPTVITKGETTKAALFEAAAGKRFVHLATHGWFAPDSVKSTEDAEPTAPGRTMMTAEERVTGFAPMTLCGLALAGANRGRDSLGRVPGILTAEELCSLDLSQCELAVLSACETNVGIRRAGQGIQSLQAALYAAGARTSITSLWKVDDRATRTLMEIFYENLWLEKMPKAEALWEAKRALRDEGHEPRDWAGWILTGDPD